jgi:hypothetical protein
MRQTKEALIWGRGEEEYLGMRRENEKNEKNEKRVVFFSKKKKRFLFHKENFKRLKCE